MTTEKTKKSKKKIDNQSGYDLWSSFYDQDSNSAVASDELHFSRFWKHLRDKKVLEIGCGTGRNTRKLLEQGNEVFGLDLSAGMLAEAKRKIQSDRVRWVQGDFFTHHWAGTGAGAGAREVETFDAAICSLVIEHFEDLDLFFGKLSNLIRKGGEVFISEIHPDRIKAGTQANFTAPDSGESFELKSFAHSSESVESAILRAGFQIEKSEDIFGDEAFAAINAQWIKHLGKPLIKIWCLFK